AAAAPAAPAGSARSLGDGGVLPAPARGWVPAAQAPARSEPISSVPGASSRPVIPAAAGIPAGAIPAPAEEENDDVEMTRVVSRSRGTGIRLAFDDGATVRVAGTALLGRNPAPAIGESADQLIDFADMGRSVSKTHLHLQADGASGLWVTDRNSTNGSSVVAPDGRHVALEAHSPVLAPAGSTVYFGDRHFTVAL
ncbi:FHA domain-containing protein, partial [Arthrobacter sp.]|uniref:FHA domain-containing protein n=1 Tax=Arthrobacter sp. TaxID=1667 RepID=UPI0028A07EC2